MTIEEINKNNIVASIEGMKPRFINVVSIDFKNGNVVVFEENKKETEVLLKDAILYEVKE